MKFDPVAVPFPMPPVFSQEKRHRYMLSCLKNRFPKLLPRPKREDSISLVAYGPSLRDTWQDIKPPIMTMSGAYNFLLDRGIVADYHVDMDPRPHKVEFISRPQKQTTFVMATVCNPWTWEILRDYHVVTWHAMSGDDTQRFLKKWDPESLLIAGGSCIGLAAVHVAGCFGHYHFEMHGYDGSWNNGMRHAGHHGGFVHGEVDTPEIAGRTFKSSRLMMNSNIEMEYLMKNFPIYCVFHGDGYTQWWARHSELPNIAVDGTDKAERIRNAKIVTATTEQVRNINSELMVRQVCAQS
jgi:hypothetical protein